MINLCRRSIYALAVVVAFSGCTSSRVYYDKSQRNWQNSSSPDTLKRKYSVFLIGDAGNPESNRTEPVFKLLRSQLLASDSISDKTGKSEDAVIFLGDNIYETGLPKADAADRKEKERRIIEQMKIVKDFGGRTIFIPGNHDWNESGPGGYEAILREEEFIEGYLDSADVFLPGNACAGPVEVPMNDDLVIVVIDSEWWLHKHRKPLAPDNGCITASRLELIRQVRDIVLRNRGKNIVFAQHHPLFSNGTHGGFFTLKDYIFPLTLVRDNWYVPLPVIGSIYPLMRQYGVSRQDLSNKHYQQLKRSLLSVLGEEKNIVIAAGHEHALQLNRYNNINHIVSGSGSKSTPLTRGNGALFADGAKGFARLDYYDNGQCWVEFWEPVDDGSTGKLVYRSPLYALPPTDKKEIRLEALVNYKDSIKTIAAGEEYKAGPTKRKLWGEHYRDEWATPVNVKYLDLVNFAGGLSPIKMGGGKQTTSLQLKGADGNLYQFRSVNKTPSNLLPEGFEKTFAEDIVQDQTSAAHPYGALIIPGMAKAIGIYHTNPQLVYMPYSRLLGPYIQEVGGKLGIIEVRPDEDLSDFSSFGNTENAISTGKLYEELQEDNDNEVDQEMYLRARLFDILIGDWDRHEDQWRWAEFKKEKGSVYRPIPRDRDQAFVKYDGFFPGLITQRVRDLVSFEMKLGSLARMSIAARNLDRNFLNDLNINQWKKIAADVKTRLTDSVIESSVKRLPPEIFKLSGEEIISKLKSRREQLAGAALDYYKVLASGITVAGSDKKEFFSVTRSKNNTKLTVQKIDKDDEIKDTLYQRVYQNNETKELNLFGLGGKDSVLLQGQSAGRIKVRVIGGEGQDNITDHSNGAQSIVYDYRSNKNSIEKGSNTILHLSNRSWVNEYDSTGFRYDRIGVIPSADYYNSLDGIYIGAGYTRKHYGFRKQPYAYEQTTIGNIAPKTGAFNLRYNGIFYSPFAHRVDVLLESSYNNFKYVRNYYGIGNSTPNVGDNQDFFRLRGSNFNINSYIQYRVTDAFKVGIGPGFEYIRIVDNDQDKFINSPAFPDKNDLQGPSRFATVKAYANVSLVDNVLFPTAGVKWRNEVAYFNELTSAKTEMVRLKSELSFYATPNFNFPLTAAIRLGAAHNIGDYKFFLANTLGNNTNLRGYRNDRFSGNTSYYQNTEIRLKVSSFRNYILNGNFGVLGFFDAGRVNSDLPESTIWHYSYGPGIWLNIYNQLTVSGGFGISKESKLFNFSTGLRF